jgi:hypothetical protein
VSECASTCAAQAVLAATIGLWEERLLALLSVYGVGFAAVVVNSIRT